MKKFIYGKFEPEEIRDYNFFKEFAVHYPKLFSKHKRTPIAEYYDVDCLNITGGCIDIELKARAPQSDTHPDCFIEVKKWVKLMDEWRKGGKYPIYINFIGDASNIYVYYLPEIPDKNVAFHPNIPIRGEIEDRIGLPWNYAYHYVFDEENNEYILTKPTEKRIENKKARKVRDNEWIS